MKPDIYTKVVLTIIAACLFIIAFRDISIIPDAKAQSYQGPVEVDVVSIGGNKLPKPLTTLSNGPSIPVEVTNFPPELRNSR